MDYRLALMCGIDIPIPECQLIVHQPRIKEIAFIGEQDFFVGAQCLCLNKTMFVEDKNVLLNTNNFQIFMAIMQEKETRDKKDSVLQVLSLLFPNYKPLITPVSLLLNSSQGDSIIIDDNNFEILQEVFRAIFCSNEGPMDQQTFNPANDKAKEIAEKIMRGRKRIAEQKSNSQNSIFSQYLSILTVGLNSMSLSELMDLTMFQLYDLIERFGLYSSWDLDVKSRLAGGKPDKEPDNWMKSLH